MFRKDMSFIISNIFHDIMMKDIITSTLDEDKKKLYKVHVKKYDKIF